MEDKKEELGNWELKEMDAKAEELLESKNSLEEAKMQEGRKRLKGDNRGIGIVEIILILVILIALVLLFQTQIKEIVKNALDSIGSGEEKIIG